MKKIKLLMIATGFLLSGFSNIHASSLQPGESLNVKYNNGAFVYQMPTASHYSTVDATNNLVKWLGFENTDVTFKELKNTKGFEGMQDVSYQQFYKGITISGAIVHLHFRNDVLQNMNGKIAHLTNEHTVNALLSASEAKAKALNQLNIVKELRTEEPTLTFMPNTNDFNKLQLVYNFSIYGIDKNRKYVSRSFYIDAQNGSIMASYNKVLNENINTTGKTLYYSSQNIVTNKLPGATNYVLRDSINGVMTYNASGVRFNQDTGFSTDIDYKYNQIVWDSNRVLKNYILINIDSFAYGLNDTVLSSAIYSTENTNNQKTSGVNIYGYDTLPIPYTIDGEYMIIDTNLTYNGLLYKMDYNYNVLSNAGFPIGNLSIGTHPWTSYVGGRTGTYTISNSLNPAVDAHWGMEQTHKFYLNELNRNSYDNQGGVIKNYVNGEQLVDGIQNNAAALEGFNVMIYGMGDNQRMGPVVGVDVMGHEFTHLVIANNGNGGLYYQGESGALNESFADMFGTAIEHYSLDTAANWLMGDKVMLEAPHYFRSMANPKNTQCPDTYHGDYWVDTAQQYDQGGVHYNSGIGNKWFYLIVQGGSGTNDNQTAYNVTGIGWDKSQKIVYNTITSYITPSSTYLEACNATLLAATNLYGANSAEYTTVRNAWIAVGVLNPNSTGVNDIPANALNVRVYPNPVTNGKLTIHSESGTTFNGQLMSISGQTVKNISIHQGDNNINLSGIAAGIYMFKMTDSAGTSYSQKITVE